MIPGKTTRWYEHKALNISGWVCGVMFFALIGFNQMYILFTGAFWLLIAAATFGGNTKEHKEILRQKITTTTAVTTLGMLILVNVVLAAILLITRF